MALWPHSGTQAFREAALNMSLRQQVPPTLLPPSRLITAGAVVGSAAAAGGQSAVAVPTASSNAARLQQQQHLGSVGTATSAAGRVAPHLLRRDTHESQLSDIVYL
jgi:hypothetical protein